MFSVDLLRLCDQNESIMHCWQTAAMQLCIWQRQEQLCVGMSTKALHISTMSCSWHTTYIPVTLAGKKILYFPISRSLLYIPGVRVSSCRGYRWPTAASIGRVAMRWNTSFPPSPPTAAWPGSASRTLRNSPSPCADITQWMREIKLKIQCLQ